jgi:hypothetical protein
MDGSSSHSSTIVRGQVLLLELKTVGNLCKGLGLSVDSPGPDDSTNDSIDYDKGHGVLIWALITE